MNKQTSPSERTRLKRAHERGHFDCDTIYSIIDSAQICHVGYVKDGSPFVIPTFHWRDGNRIYWHAASSSAMIRSAEDTDVCLTITHLDGMVMARSAFHHSANYRSVMVFGKPDKVPENEKEHHLRNFIESLWPGRWDELRPINNKELKATTILGLSLDETSAKIRTGPPKDDEEDYVLPIWAGVLPLQTTVLKPIHDERNIDGVSPPDNIASFLLDKTTDTD